VKRGIIYITGLMGLVFLAALTLPRVGRTIEAQLQTDIDFALADKGLGDIEAHMDGQTVTFAYRPGTTSADSQPPRHMALAMVTAETLTGGLYDKHGGYGPVWGPITRTKVDLSSPATNSPAP